jgi:hypothetical protein
MFLSTLRIRGSLMRRPTHPKISLMIWILLLLGLAWGSGCQPAKPPLSPKADAFAKEIQALINRLAPPLIEPVAQKDMKVIQKELIKVFTLCDKACEGVFYNVFILDKEGELTAVYPPAEVKRFQFSNYKMVQKAFTEKKPNQSILYQPDGTATYIVCLPLLRGDEVTGILALGFDGETLRDKRGVNDKEFMAIEFQSPRKNGQEKE